jgi:diguanylate cyclase (GGDEF)-like protein
MIFVTAGGFISYSAWVISHSYNPAVEDIVSSALLIVLMLFVAVLGSAIAMNKISAPALRRPWLLIALAAFSNAIAEFLWYYYSVVLHKSPFPSIADVFYLLFYPLLLAGILCLPFLPLGRERRVLFGLDTLIIVVVGGLFLWYFILAPMQVQGEGSFADTVALIYPVADLLLLTSLVALIQRDVNDVDRMVLISLSVSMLATLFVDILFAINETYGIPYEMPSLNIWWMASYAAMVVAAARQILHPTAKGSGASGTFHPLLRNALLYLGPTLGLGLAFFNFITGTADDLRLRGTLVVSIFLVFLVLLRQYVVLRDNMRLYKEMEQLAVTDALTGLYNRHYFNTAIETEVKRAERYKRSLSILMMDVDNFKAYNDTHGHLEGDKMLQNIANLLRSRIRATDLLARFGGDEFVAILTETNREQAQAVALKIEQSMAGRYKQHDLGMSIGIAVSQPGLSATNLLAEADKQLYLVKPKRKKENGGV